MIAWEDAVQQARENAREVSRLFDRTANALEQSARLAYVHADREQRAGRIDAAVEEQLVAVRAGEAADRARSQAARFGGLAVGVTPDDASDDRPVASMTY